jgi:ribosomal protein S18 acetylase RimI-like enzyme
MTFELLDGRQAAELAADVQALHAEVYPASGSGQDAADGFAARLLVQRRQPGFALAVARSGGYLVGCAAGMPLRLSTSWWRDLTTKLPDELTAEHPGRTFALTELIVRAPWRRQGIGRALHDLLLDGRAEERATLVVPSASAAAQSFQRWGWHRVGRTQDREAGGPAADVLIADLPLGR